jgi:hypothetical protein
MNWGVRKAKKEISEYGHQFAAPSSAFNPDVPTGTDLVRSRVDFYRFD